MCEFSAVTLSSRSAFILKHVLNVTYVSAPVAWVSHFIFKDRDRVLLWRNHTPKHTYIALKCRWRVLEWSHNLYDAYFRKVSDFGCVECSLVWNDLLSQTQHSLIEVLDGCISIGHVENCTMLNFLLIKPQTFPQFLTCRAVLWGRRTEEKESL